MIENGETYFSGTSTSYSYNRYDCGYSSLGEKLDFEILDILDGKMLINGLARQTLMMERVSTFHNVDESLKTQDEIRRKLPGCWKCTFDTTDGYDIFYLFITEDFRANYARYEFRRSSGSGSTSLTGYINVSGNDADGMYLNLYKDNHGILYGPLPVDLDKDGDLCIYYPNEQTCERLPMTRLDDWGMYDTEWQTNIYNVTDNEYAMGIIKFYPDGKFKYKVINMIKNSSDDEGRTTYTYGDVREYCEGNYWVRYDCPAILRNGNYYYGNERGFAKMRIVNISATADSFPYKEAKSIIVRSSRLAFTTEEWGNSIYESESESDIVGSFFFRNPYPEFRKIDD